MRHWERVLVDSKCGYCGAQLGEGMPIQVLEITGVKRRRIRCEDCADGAAPADLPRRQLPQDLTQRMQQLAECATVEREWMPFRED